MINRTTSYVRASTTSFVLFLIFFPSSVNFKKNEKVYNPENSEVLKALQENDSEPEPGNDGGVDSNVTEDNDVRDERYSHYYAMACMLKLLNSGDGNGSLFSNDKLIDWIASRYIVVVGDLSSSLHHFLTPRDNMR